MLKLDVIVKDVKDMDFSSGEFSSVIVQYPDTNGNISDFSQLIETAHANKVCTRVIFLYLKKKKFLTKISGFCLLWLFNI